MDAQTIKEHIDSVVYENNRMGISATAMNGVLTEMLNFQVQEDTSAGGRISDLEERLSNSELNNLLNL